MQVHAGSHVGLRSISPGLAPWCFCDIPSFPGLFWGLAAFTGVGSDGQCCEEVFTQTLTKYRIGQNHQTDVLKAHSLCAE